MVSSTPLGAGKNEKGMVNIHQRVETVLGIMGLLWCKDKLIADTPSTRGTQGNGTLTLTPTLTVTSTLTSTLTSPERN